MRDCPHGSEGEPAYIENVLEPLARGEGIACFLARCEDELAVLFFTHTLTGAAHRRAHEGEDRARATQAIAVQMAARARAVEAGIGPIVP